MISVIVCTFNRCTSLARTLNELVACEPPDCPWEIVVVDNNSIDDTALVVARFQDQSDVRVRYVFERRQGLSYARNTGVEAARGDILAFTDDDCRPDRRWLQEIDRTFSAETGLGAVAGRVEPGPGVDPRVGTRTSPDPADIRSLQDIRQHLMGANLSFRRRAWLAAGPFDTNLGAGTPSRSGEDIDFAFRILRSGERLAYCPAALVEHWHDRVGDEAISMLRRGYITGRGAFTMKWLLALDPALSKTLYWNVVSLLRRDPSRTPSRGDLSRLATTRLLIQGAIAWLCGTLRRKTALIPRASRGTAT